MDIVQQISDYMDGIVDTFVMSTLANVIATAIPLVGIAMTMSFMLRGAMMMMSPGGQPLGELLKQFAGAAMIISFAGAGGFYQSDIADMIMSLPDEIASTVLAGDMAPGASLAEVIDDAMTSAMEVVRQAIDQVGLSGSGFMSALLAGQFIVVTILIAGIAMAYVLVSKILLAIVVAFGPAFIFMLLFKPTKPLFSKWIGSVINYSILLVLLAAVVGIMVDMYGNAMDSAANGDANLVSAAASTGIIAIASIVATLKLPGLASSWGSGISSNLLGFMPGAAMAGSAARSGGGAAGGAAASGAASNAASGAAAGAAGSGAGQAASGAAGAAGGAGGAVGRALRYARR